LAKSPEDVLGTVFADPKIGGAAECDSSCMAKNFPKPVRMFYRGSRTRAPNRFTSDNAIICVIERHHHKLGNLRHANPPSARLWTGVFANLLLDFIVKRPPHILMQIKIATKTSVLRLSRSRQIKLELCCAKAEKRGVVGQTLRFDERRSIPAFPL
jgi:hypothetical protein